MKNKSKSVSIFLFFSLLFFDQLSKYLIRSRGGFYICNSGIAFGIAINPILFWAILILISFVFLYYSVKSKIQNPKSETNSPPKADQPRAEKLKIQNWMIFILSGTIANLIDRARFGCVIDFIDLRIWPVFNLADAFITIGALLLLAKYFKKWYNIPEKKR